MVIERIPEDEKKIFSNANQYFSSEKFKNKKRQDKRRIPKDGNKILNIYFWRGDKS